MRIALLGDIHHYRLFVPPWRLMSKRLVGQTNLWLNRRRCFNRTLLMMALNRIASIKPDLLLLSGDLTTTSLEAEFADIAAVLEPLSGRIPIVAVPGNHDRYTFGAARHRRMEQMLPSIVPQQFPHFRKLTGRWHLLALDGAKPNVMSARGRLGEDQLRACRQYASQLTKEDGLIVLCHYPIKSPPRALPITWDHKLADSGRLRRLLVRCPARLLYLHGHIHRPWCWQPKRSDQSHFTYLNAGAPCMVNSKHPCGQGFWEIDLPDDPAAHVNVVHHVPVCDSRPKRINPLKQDRWQARQVM